MEIKRMAASHIPQVVALWYEVSIESHDFISSDYWQQNREAMAREYLPESETYLAVEQDDILGFGSVAGSYLAALFVKSSAQGRGIGKGLLNYIKGAEGVSCA